MDLTRVVPQPTPISLGGRDWLASEFRVGDVAEFQSWVNSLGPSPYEAAVEELFSRPRDLGWKRLLAGVLEAQERWPPDRHDYLWTTQGQVKQVHLALRRNHPEVDERAAFDIVRGDHAIENPARFDEDFARLFRVAWGADPMDSLRLLIDGPQPKKEHEPEDWTGIYYSYMTKSKNGPPFQDLTWTQLRMFLHQGKSTDDDREDHAGLAQRRRDFWKDLEDDGHPQTSNR